MQSIFFSGMLLSGGVVIGAAFKPLLTGVARATVLLFKPRKTLEQKQLEARRKDVHTLLRLANEYDSLQPNLAQEMRHLACRD